MSVASASTIGSYITNYRRQTIKMSDFFYKGVLADEAVKLYVNDDSILNLYDELLKPHKIKYTMTNEEFRKYKYNPQRLAHDIYGNSEYWWLLLHANELSSASEFGLQTLWIYKNSVIPVIKDILVVTRGEQRKALSMAEEEMKENK